METFEQIFNRAAERKGGQALFETMLPEPASKAQLRRLKDEAVLAEMTKCIFRSGFVWRVIDNKWPGFEAAFRRFNIKACAMLSDEDLERLQTNEAIVRNGTKIATVRENAAYIMRVSEEYGSFGKFLAQWPDDDFIELWGELKNNGARLGGQTGRYMLRFIGRDTPTLSADVVRALVAQGVVDKEPTSKTALRKTQDAFNEWRQESGRPYCQISRTLACSVPD